MSFRLKAGSCEFQPAWSFSWRMWEKFTLGFWTTLQSYIVFPNPDTQNGSIKPKARRPVRFHVHLCFMVSQGARVLLICPCSWVDSAQAGRHLWCILISRFICAHTTMNCGRDLAALLPLCHCETQGNQSALWWIRLQDERTLLLFFLKYTNNIKPVPICYVPARSLLLFLPPFFFCIPSPSFVIVEEAGWLLPSPTPHIPPLPTSPLFCIFISC